MIGPMTTATSTARRPRRVLAFLAAVLAVAVGLFAAAPASAATTSAAQNTVGASTPAGQVAVGASASISAGQRLGNDPPLPGIVVATGVAAETGALESRANALHGVLHPIAQNSRTTAALGTREGQTVLASGGRDLSRAQRALAQDGEMIARSPAHMRR